ncbi:hypothetical protein CYMTET_43305 [Cymbomonas tetramitiformis]|uniref:Uncharacterized protein n=1 Tax=Cymbomonas tetramitiformis TaxID=36881 RepID=A0AAE0C2F4_9CHLO|nr:hypothetical protein CYMTET_43305 [Cymbomonas tetramitiformis]
MCEQASRSADTCGHAISTKDIEHLPADFERANPIPPRARAKSSHLFPSTREVFTPLAVRLKSGAPMQLNYTPVAPVLRCYQFPMDCLSGGEREDLEANQEKKVGFKSGLRFCPKRITTPGGEPKMPLGRQRLAPSQRERAQSSYDLKRANNKDEAPLSDYFVISPSVHFPKTPPSNVTAAERRLLRATMVPRSSVDLDLVSEASGNIDFPPPSPQSPQSPQSPITQSPRSSISQTSSAASTNFSVGPAGLPSSSSLISGWIGRGAPRRDFSTGESSKREYGFKAGSPKKRAAGKRKPHSKSRHSSEPRQTEELLHVASRVVPACLPRLTKSTSEKAEDEKCSIAILKMELKDMVVS